MGTATAGLTIDPDEYFSWTSGILDWITEDPNTEIATEALKHAHKIKASISMAAIEKIAKVVSSNYLTYCIELAAISDDRKEAVDFLLEQLG